MLENSACCFIQISSVMQKDFPVAIMCFDFVSGKYWAIPLKHFPVCQGFNIEGYIAEDLDRQNISRVAVSFAATLFSMPHQQENPRTGSQRNSSITHHRTFDFHSRVTAICATMLCATR